jgi:hypothetical protein
VAYTKEEVKAFAEKDLRISKLAIVKSLIEKLPLEDAYDVQKITDLAEKYIDYVYEERREATKRGQVGCVASDTEGVKWEQIAEGLNLAKPNSQNIKMLNLLLDEYKKAYKASANPSTILVHIINTFGEYPTKTKSVETVVKSFERLEK